MKFTHKLPNKAGYYWFTNFGESTPTIVEVTKSDRKFYASNENFCFEIEEAKFEKDPDLKVGKHYYGEEMWCYIPVPTLDGKKIKPDCY